MKIERPFLPQLPICFLRNFFFFFLEVHFRIGVFMPLKPYWKELLDIAEHIWAHLDSIAHRAYELLGDWVSVSQAVAMFETLGLCCRRPKNVVSLCIGSGEAFR